MEICSEPQWRKWLPTSVPSMVMKLPRNGPAKRRSLSEPAYSQAIQNRHAARVKATRERIELRLKSLRVEKAAIEAEIIQTPTDRGLLKEMREVDDQIARGDIELTDEVDMKLTDDEWTAMRGEPTERQLRALRRAGERSTLCYLASAPKCW
jgi:hypothetical protein